MPIRQPWPTHPPGFTVPRPAKGCCTASSAGNGLLLRRWTGPRDVESRVIAEVDLERAKRDRSRPARPAAAVALLGVAAVGSGSQRRLEFVKLPALSHQDSVRGGRDVVLSRPQGKCTGNSRGIKDMRAEPVFHGAHRKSNKFKAFRSELVSREVGSKERANAGGPGGRSCGALLHGVARSILRVPGAPLGLRLPCRRAPWHCRLPQACGRVRLVSGTHGTVWPQMDYGFSRTRHHDSSSPRDLSRSDHCFAPRMQKKCPQPTESNCVTRRHSDTKISGYIDGADWSLFCHYGRVKAREIECNRVRSKTSASLWLARDYLVFCATCRNGPNGFSRPPPSTTRPFLHSQL